MAEPQDNLVQSEPGLTDTDRQQVLDELRRHMANGRLSLEEYETRTGVAYRATTTGQLRPLTSDLPAQPTAASPPAGPDRYAHRPPPSRSADLMSIPSFRVHLFLWLVFSAFWMVIWLGSVMATGGWVPFWPVFPIAAFGLSVGIHAAVRKGLSP